MIAGSNILPHPNPPLVKGRELIFRFPPKASAMVYTQVIESPLFLKLPLPNPPRCFGEGKGKNFF
jgi:hypothetical protein